MIAKKYIIRTGIGISDRYLPSFDKALIQAGVGNYNLVRLSSILPAGCEEVEAIDLPEGSLLPTAYSTISSNTVGDTIVSTIGVGIPKDSTKVGVIMEFSAVNMKAGDAVDVLKKMIHEAFEVRGWELKEIKYGYIETVVGQKNETRTTFACVAEWE